MGRIALLLILVSLAGMALADSHPPSSVPNSQSRSRAQEVAKGGSTPAVSVVVNNQVGTQTAVQKPKEVASEKNDDFFSGWTVGDKIALLVAFIALLQFGALYKTYDIMQESAKIQLRAYVSIREEDKGRRIQEGQKILFEPIILNTGLTPAYNLKFKANIVTLPPGITDESLLPILPDVATSSVSTLFPRRKAALVYQSDWAASRNDIASFYLSRARESSKALYFYGTIYYTTFKEACQTDFCFEIKVNANGVVSGWHVAAIHNGST